MAKIELKTRLASPDGCYQPGAVIDRADASALVNGGYAVYVEPMETIKSEPVPEEGQAKKLNKKSNKKAKG